MDREFKYHFFICHSSKDKAVVTLLVQKLRSFDCKVFFDYSNLSAEVDISEIIEDALKNSIHLIIINSKHIVNSKWIKWECNYFFQFCVSNQRRIIPYYGISNKVKYLPPLAKGISIGTYNHEDLLKTVNIDFVINDSIDFVNRDRNMENIINKLGEFIIKSLKKSIDDEYLSK